MASDCPVCQGSGWLFAGTTTCPLCEDTPASGAENGAGAPASPRLDSAAPSSTHEDECSEGRRGPDEAENDTSDSASEHTADEEAEGEEEDEEEGQHLQRPPGDANGSFLAAVEESEQNGDNKPTARATKSVWEVNLGTWLRVDPALEGMLREAQASGKDEFEYCARRQTYLVNIASLTQTNLRTGVVRELRCSSQVEDDDSDEEGPETEDAEGEFCECFEEASDHRRPKLVEQLLSPSVQVPLPAPAAEEPARLSPEEVEKVFTNHVSGVKNFLYRGQCGMYSLSFIKTAYSDGMRAYYGTEMYGHLLGLMRLIVHHAHDGGAGTANYLTQVAEAFMDCQAVQARVVERVGLEIRGVVLDFRGLVTKLVGDYKTLAIKMLAHDRIGRHLAHDDGNPTHYENRLTADLGKLLGLNADDIRRAALDEHAASRFPILTGRDRERAASRARELFDLGALLKVLVSEVNSLSPDSPADSMPRTFLDWAFSRLKEKHVVFDEETCCHVDVGEPLVLAILEDLFMGQPAAPDEVYRGLRLSEILAPSE